MMSEEEMTEEARPEGVRELDQRKLPLSREVVSPDEIVQSIECDSSRLFKKICAFNTDDCLKKFIASSFNALGIMPDSLEAMSNIFWYFGAIFLKDLLVLSLFCASVNKPRRQIMTLFLLFLFLDLILYFYILFSYNLYFYFL